MYNKAIESSSPSSAVSAASEASVIKTLLRLGIPAGTKGFYYIKVAVTYGLEYPISLSSMSKNIYPTIAKQYYISNSSRIERDIRYAISQSVVRGDPEFIRHVFGYGCDTDGFNPTNREFLSVVAEYVKRNLTLNAPA